MRYLPSDRLLKPEAEQQLYDGFLPNNDRYLLDEVRNTTSEGFKSNNFIFQMNVIISYCLVIVPAISLILCPLRKRLFG